MDMLAAQCRDILAVGGAGGDGIRSSYGGVYMADERAGADRQPHPRRRPLRQRPADSVLDPDCRAWQFDNLYVTDGALHAHLGRRQPDADDPGQRLPRRRRHRQEGLAMDPTSTRSPPARERHLPGRVLPRPRLPRAYLNATRSPRYRYNVRDVRGKHDIIVIKGEVYLDGQFLELRARRVPIDRPRERARARASGGPAAPGMALLARGRGPRRGHGEAARVQLTRRLSGRAVGDAGGARERLPRHQRPRSDGEGRPHHPRRSPAPGLRDRDKLRRTEIAFREDDARPPGFTINEPAGTTTT